MIRPATEADLAAMASVAATEQARPDRHVAYVGIEADGIASELADIDDWTDHAWLDEETGAWLVAESDEELGRTWLIGPFQNGAWTVVDDLYSAAREALPELIVEEELAPDERNADLISFALRHGFVAEEGSAILTLEEPLTTLASPDVRTMADADHDAVWAIHEGAFPGTHLTRTLLLQSDERNMRLVIEADGDVAGYIVVEVQADGSGYIDYLGVDPRFRGKGFGRKLIVAGVHALAAAGGNGANLSVRASNTAARSLYTSIGFTEERVIVPYRKGFKLA